MLSKSEIKLNSNFSKAEESLGFLLWKASNLLQKSHSAVLRDIDMTPAQFSMMTCLVYLSQSESATSSAISKHSGMDKMMVSDLVKTLSKKELIQTFPNSEDKRSFVIKPTTKGVRITNLAVRKIEDIDDVFFGNAKVSKDFSATLKSLIVSNSQDKNGVAGNRTEVAE
jgi:DNA-binding MarR family transcriptional regulator